MKLNLNPYYIDYRRFFNNPLLYSNLTRYNARFLLKRVYKTFKDKNIEFIYYSNIFNEITLDYDNWQDLKKYAESSTIRFFKNSEIDYKNEYVRYYYNLSLKNAVLSRNIGKFILEKIKPDIYINPHGIYSTHGPVFDYLKKNGIKSFINGGWVSHTDDKNKIIISDSKMQLLSSSKFWHQFKKTPVNENMKKMVDSYFKFRLSGQARDTKLLYSGKKSIYRVDKNDGYKYHIAMFPNVIWDGNIKERHIIFNGLIDWIISTINYIKDKNDIKLIIKSHPAEMVVYNNTPKIMELINQKIDLNKIKNISIVSAEEQIDTYEFLRSGIDLGLCYDGFLDIELPYLKIPAIMCVKGGFTSIEGGNFIATSKEQYFNYLDNIEELIKEFHGNYNNYRDNIIKFLFWYLYENAIRVCDISNPELQMMDFLNLKKEDLLLDEKLLIKFNYL